MGTVAAQVGRGQVAAAVVLVLPPHQQIIQTVVVRHDAAPGGTPAGRLRRTPSRKTPHTGRERWILSGAEGSFKEYRRPAESVSHQRRVFLEAVHEVEVLHGHAAGAAD